MQTVRFRALFGGLLAGVALCACTPFADSYLKTTPLAGGHFPLAAIFIFFVAAIFFSLLAKISGRPPLLSGIELLIAWALMGGPVWAWIGVVPLATGIGSEKFAFFETVTS